MSPEQMQEFRRHRLEVAIERKFGGNKSAMGRALGYKDGAFVRQMLEGSRPMSEKTVQRIERIPGAGLAGWFDVSHTRSWKPSNVVPLIVNETVPENVIAVPVSNVKFSAGPGHEANYEIVESSQPAYYQREWFARERINPDRARRFEVTGDSMEPLVSSGDYVLVDTADTTIVDGKVYALRYGSELRIKRVWRHLDGTLLLRSDNKDYVDESVPPHIASEHITIIGRVRDRSGPGGL